MFLFIDCFSLVSRHANCECFGFICSLLLSSLFSSFSSFLWIDLLDLAIPMGVKQPLLALVVDDTPYDLIELIGNWHFSDGSNVILRFQRGSNRQIFGSVVEKSETPLELSRWANF